MGVGEELQATSEIRVITAVFGKKGSLKFKIENVGVQFSPVFNSFAGAPETGNREA